MSGKTTTLVWLRLDLRLGDNPPLTAAANRGRVVPVFIWSPDEDSASTPGAASRWWLHHSLQSLTAELQTLGSRLIVRKGPTLANLLAVAEESGADAVFMSRRFEPGARAREREIEAALTDRGLEVRTFLSGHLFEPGQPRNKSGAPYQVFGPFWRAAAKLIDQSRPLTRPRRLAAPATWPTGLSVASLGLLPRHDWTAGLNAAWEPGEPGARRALARFRDQALADYATARDEPAKTGTSRLSPHLHFGEISPRQIWHSLMQHNERHPNGSLRTATESFVRELGWREFAHNQLVSFPQTVTQPLKKQFAAFPWIKDARRLRAWQRGVTGYPIVDAGMRELLHTGWMHNRVRMIVASFLVKHLLIHWREGAAWFWDTLVDADLANNTLNWQWVAGSGADAAPYFRIFNPVLQGRTFDPNGEYVRRWIPELARLGADDIHAPWTAPPLVLQAAGVVLGKNYPRPIVKHEIARDRALSAYAMLKHK